jgi:maleylpyruvate isomerase
MRRGEDFFLTRALALDDRALAEPSGLPGWTRAHVVAHIARNADALRNLLAWARTGVETPMYASLEERATGIEESSRQAPGALRSDVSEASARWLAAVDDMPPEAWDGPVRTRGGRRVTGLEVPWMRIRETWVHSVDLGVGATFEDVPAAVVEQLIGEVAGGLAGREDCPAVVLHTDTGTWRLGPEGDAVDVIDVTGTDPAVLAWLVGRDTGDAGASLRTTTTDGRPPALPPWL